MNKQDAPLANDRIKLFRKNIFGDRLNSLRTLLPEKTALRKDIVEEYQTSNENVQNYIITTKNFGPETENVIKGIFSKPSNRGPSNIAARTTILRHASDLLKDREDDSLKYGHMPIGLLLSKKKKFLPQIPSFINSSQRWNKKKSLSDESMLKFYQNFNNNNNFQQQNTSKNFSHVFFFKVVDHHNHHHHHQQLIFHRYYHHHLTTTTLLLTLQTLIEMVR